MRLKFLLHSFKFDFKGKIAKTKFSSEIAKVNFIDTIIIIHDTLAANICVVAGTVSLWSPSVSSPLVKLQCHRGPLTSLALDQGGHYLVTAALDAKMKVHVHVYKHVQTVYTI